MRTNSELLERAYGIAEAHFYSDDECEIAWEPFENWSEDDIKEQLHDLAQTILRAMQWAQGVEND